MLEEIKVLLQELNLLGMLEYLDIKHAEFLPEFKNFLLKEQEARKVRSINYRLAIAKLPYIKFLQDTQQACLVNSINIIDIIKNHINLIFIGASGSAKTHLAISLAYNAILLGKRVRFFKLSQLAKQLLIAKEHNNEIKLMLHLKNFDLLIIDELGYVPIEEKSGPLLFDLFSQLYELVPIMITTHLNFSEWSNLFGDTKATKAIIDRLTHHCKIIETGNKSFRLENKK